MASGDLPEQGLGRGDRGQGRVQVAGAAGHGQPDLGSGQPGRDFTGNGKALKQAFRRGQRRTVRNGASGGQLERGFHQQGVRPRPGDSAGMPR